MQVATDIHTHTHTQTWGPTAVILLLPVCRNGKNKDSCDLPKSWRFPRLTKWLGEDPEFGNGDEMMGRQILERGQGRRGSANMKEKKGVQRGIHSVRKQPDDPSCPCLQPREGAYLTEPGTTLCPVPHKQCCRTWILTRWIWSEGLIKASSGSQEVKNTTCFTPLLADNQDTFSVALGGKESPCVDVQLTASRVDFTENLPLHLYTPNTHTHTLPLRRRVQHPGYIFKTTSEMVRGWRLLELMFFLLKEEKNQWEDHSTCKQSGAEYC